MTPISDDKLEVRLTRLEERVNMYAKTEYVNSAIHGLTLTVEKFSASLHDLTNQIGTVSKRQEQLFSTHDELLKERAEHERQQALNEKQLLERKLEETSPLGLAKRWLPVASLLVAIVTLFTVLSKVIDLWLQTRTR